MSDNTQLDMFEQVDGKTYIREGNAPFIVVHFPNSWDMVDGEWLPQLAEVPVVPGVNYVSGSAAEPNIDGLLKLIERKGGVVVSPLDTRLGEFQGFLKRRDGLHKVTGYSDYTPKCSYHYFGCGITDEMYETVCGKKALIFRTDEWRYNQFRKLLVTSGIVKPITDKCIEAINKLKQTVKDQMIAHGCKPADETVRPFYNVDKLKKWLDLQKNIHANEQAFFDTLISEGRLVEAACYTLHMSNPPPLEQVMNRTALGKTSIYNKLKELRAMEKSIDYTYAGSPTFTTK